MLTAERLRDLVRLSVVEPQKGGAAVLALNLPVRERWTAMVAAVLVGVVLAFLLPVMSGRGAEIPPPMAAAGIQMGANVLAVLLATHVGRWFGGSGRLEDAVLLVAWLQALMAGVQVVQIVAVVVLPPLAGLVAVAGLGLFFWLAVGFVQALHGFRSPMLVLLGTLGALFGAAFVLSFVLILLGVDPRGLTDV